MENWAFVFQILKLYFNSPILKKKKTYVILMHLIWNIKIVSYKTVFNLKINKSGNVKSILKITPNFKN